MTLQPIAVHAPQEGRYLCHALLIRIALIFTGALYANPALGLQAQNEAPRAFYHDFRGRPLPPELTLFQVHIEKLLQVEPEGVRITIPKTWTHPWGGVGLKTAFGLKGNFEVTATYEILGADTPPAGYGVGVCLYAAAGGDKGGASVARLVRPGGDQVMLWDLTYDSPAMSGVTSCTDKIGRLRLVRMGTTLYYLWAPGIEGQDFQVFHQSEFGNTDIDYVRLGALNGRTASNVDVRLLDLRIQDQMKTVPVANSSRGRLAVAILIGLVVALSLALGLWFYAR